jgi:hypothetical protein
MLCIHYVRMAMISFLYVDFPKILSHIYLLVNSNGCPSCINIAPTPFPEESNFKMKLLVNSNMSKTRVLKIDYIKT